MNHVVLWNGSRHHPGGRQLFTEEHVPMRKTRTGFEILPDDPIESLTWTDQLRSVRDRVAVDFQSTREIATEMGWRIDQVNCALTALLKQGEIEKEFRFARRGHNGNQRYRWTR